MNVPIFKRHAALLLRPRSWMPASTTKAPLPNRCIPVAAFSKSTDALGIVPPTPKLNVFMHHPQRTRTPSANFWAVSQAESARNATQRRRFPRSEKLAANDPAENRTEIQDPWRNRPPFPAKPSRSRRGATTGEASTAVSADAGAHPTSQGPARRQGHSNRQRRQRMGLPPLPGRIPAQRVAISAGSWVCAHRQAACRPPQSASLVIADRYSTKDARKDDRHVKNGQHAAGASSAMLQPNPSNEALIICRITLFPSCLRTISSSPGLLEFRRAFALSVSPCSKDTAKEQSSRSSPRDASTP